MNSVDDTKSSKTKCNPRASNGINKKKVWNSKYESDVMVDEDKRMHRLLRERFDERTTSIK